MATAGLHDSELGELQRRLIILRVGLLLVVALLGLQLWNLQIREGPYYRDLSANNRTRSVIMEPARGLIYDRNGVLLANNVPSFTLYVSLEKYSCRLRARCSRSRTIMRSASSSHTPRGTRASRMRPIRSISPRSYGLSTRSSPTACSAAVTTDRPSTHDEVGRGAFQSSPLISVVGSSGH